MNTRISSITATGRKQTFTLPTGFANPITAYIWGGGGGAGGADANGKGGNGAAGQLVKVVFEANVGDILEVSIGAGGGRGVDHGRNASGGLGGSSFVDDSANSYSGGDGGNSGTSGLSGAGGGGGGATVLSLYKTSETSRVVLAIAGGGGGGGGAGNQSPADGKTASSTGSGNTGFRSGQSGEDNTGDGGGGGGGGGGYFGGNAGAISTSYDRGADAGITGSSWANALATISQTIVAGNGQTPASIDDYNVGDHAKGGTGGRLSPSRVASTAGGDGIAIVDLILSPFPYVKVAGSWVRADAGWVKDGGQWRPITASYTKINGQWRPISSAGGPPVFSPAGASINYGPGGTRAYPAE